MLYDSYSCRTENVNVKQEEESYVVPEFDGARISKLVPPGKLLRCVYGDAKTCVQALERGCRLSENGRCVGWRSSKNEYSWLTYKEFMSRALYFGSGLSSLGIKLGQSCRIGIYAQNSVEWLVSQYACFYHSSVVAPLYDTIGPDARTFMINNAETQVVVCDQDKKAKSLLDNIAMTPVLKHIIHMKNISEETKRLGKIKGIKMHLFTDIEALGKTFMIPTNVPQPTDEAIICYTSGTTGNPKGAILSHQNIIAGISGFIRNVGEKINLNKDDISISYLPLAHSYEQLLEVLLFLHGGSIGYFSGDVSLLSDDMQVLKPTVFGTVPRVLNKIYDKAMSQIKMFQSNRQENECDKTELSSSPTESKNEPDYMPQVYKIISNSLGGEIKLIISGAAPISEDVLDFFCEAIRCKVVEVYGQTECGGPCCTNLVNKETIGCVGSPLVCNLIKLEDVPELEYFKENNIGEVCIKGPNVFKGYLKNPEKTAEAIDENGWLRTGDVGVWLSNGMLKIVDRKQHIFKLSQGEYIMPEKIENVYMASSYVLQIYVHGNSLQSFLVAIVIPDEREARAWSESNSIAGTWKELCNNATLKQHILEDMQRIGKTAGLLSFQQVKDIHLHSHPLTIEDGYLTPTQKIKRVTVRKNFMKEIETMYSKET